MKEYKMSSKTSFKNSFIWKVLSVTDQEGYQRKIAIKKDALKKTFKVDISGIKGAEEQILNHVDLEQKYLNTKQFKIQIPNIGIFTVNNYYLSITNPHKQIIADNTAINDTINLTKDKETVKNNAFTEEKLRIQQQMCEKEVESLKQKHNDEIIDRQWSVRQKLSSMTENLIEGYYNVETETHTFEEPNELQKSIGMTCVPKTEISYSEGKTNYDLEFLLNELQKYASNKEYNGFNNNKFTNCINKIDTINDQLKEEYSDKKVQEAYTLHGSLATDLATRFIGFCRYIEENNINTGYNYYKQSKTYYYDDKSIYEYRISNFFQKTINGIALYIERVFGSDYKDYFLEQTGTLNKSNNKINKKI